MSEENPVELPELYFCSVIAPKFEGFTDFPLYLYHGGNYRNDRSKFDYGELIQDFDPDDEENNIYSIPAVNELFTGHEAAELKRFIVDKYKSELHLHKAKIPLPNNSMACTDLPTGGGRSYFYLTDRLSENEPHNLSFRVVCWYDKRDYVHSHYSPEEIKEMIKKTNAELDEQIK